MYLLLFDDAEAGASGTFASSGEALASFTGQARARATFASEGEATVSFPSVPPVSEEPAPPQAASFPRSNFLGTPSVRVAGTLRARVRLTWYGSSVDVNVGDQVELEAEYVNGDGRPYEPRSARVVVTSPSGASSYKPDRVGLGRYRLRLTLEEPGEIRVRFEDGNQESFAEHVFEVEARTAVFVPAVRQPAPVKDTRDAVARAMMLQDLASAGMHLTAAHSDAVVASAHASLLARRAEQRRDAQRNKVRGLEPLRPQKR